MSGFIQQVASGFATGCIYACVALALVMIYQATHLVNFAQGEMAMLSTYFAWTLSAAGMGYWRAFLLTLAASFIFGMMIERLIIRQVSRGSILSVITVLVGLMIIMTSIAGWIFSYTIKTFPSPFSEAWKIIPILSPHEMGMVVVVLAMLAIVFIFFRFTPVGLAMRAAAHEPLASRLVGIRVNRMLGLGWGLAGMVGAVAGLMAAPIVYLDPHMMSGILIYGFASALLGGINNAWGAVVGGLIVGIVENLAGTYLVGTELKLTVALVLIVGVLLLRPVGLFGTATVTRV